MALASQAALGLMAHNGADPLGSLLLVRISPEGGATRAELHRDLAGLFAHKMSPADWKRSCEAAAGRLVASGLASETRNRLTIAPDGEAQAQRFLGIAPAGRPWNELRDIWLVAKALEIEGEPPAKLKALLRQDSLRGLIVQKAFALPLKKNQPVAKLRSQLALIALERAFGNKIKAGFGQRDALPAKAARLLAGQLSRQPRDFGTDARLIAELASEHAGSKDTDADSLRAALLRNIGSKLLQAPNKPTASSPRISQAPRTAPANDLGVKGESSVAARPDLNEFARKVMSAASRKAEGWPGSRKAYISHVWDAIRDAESQWGLSEIEFKCMLAEAHRAGRITLANADLKDKRHLAEIESSAVLYKNTVWHFVRVEE